MSIRLRLVLSYIAMLVVPIVLFAIAALLLGLLFKPDINELKQTYRHPDSQDGHISEDMKLFMELRKQVTLKPESFLDPAFVAEIDKRLAPFDGAFALRRNGQIVQQSLRLGMIDERKLPPFGMLHETTPITYIGREPMKQYDFFFSDGTEGTLFLMHDASPLTAFARTFFPLLLGILLFILVVTNGVLSYLVSRSIIRPISALKRAADQIRDGLGRRVSLP